MIIFTWFAYIKTKAPPKFCNPWGAVNKYIREKEMQYDMLYSLNKWKEHDGQDLKVNLKTTRSHPKYHISSQDKHKLIMIDR
jgi:hypothetical protein